MEQTQKSKTLYLDAHIILWLYDGLVEKLSESTKSAIENSTLYLSPITFLEVQFLHEIGRFHPTAQQAYHALEKDIDLQMSRLPFDRIVAEALTIHWTRDPFDRLLVAEVIESKARLITKDTEIRKHCSLAIW